MDTHTNGSQKPRKVFLKKQPKNHHNKTPKKIIQKSNETPNKKHEKRPQKTPFYTKLRKNVKNYHKINQKYTTLDAKIFNISEVPKKLIERNAEKTRKKTPTKTPIFEKRREKTKLRNTNF